MAINSELAARITELEAKAAFQEQLLEDLNQALITQQFTLDKMQIQLRYLAAKLKESQGSQIASRAEETPPPHYQFHF